MAKPNAKQSLIEEVALLSGLAGFVSSYSHTALNPKIRKSWVDGLKRRINANLEFILIQDADFDNQVDAEIQLLNNFIGLAQGNTEYEKTWRTHFEEDKDILQNLK